MISRSLILMLCGSLMMVAACTTQATISGREITDEVLEKPSDMALYNGCFWKDRLWEEDWSIKKSRQHTLKQVRVRISPWQPLAAIGTLGLWVPFYVEWELNGDML